MDIFCIQFKRKDIFRLIDTTLVLIHLLTYTNLLAFLKSRRYYSPIYMKPLKILKISDGFYICFKFFIVSLRCFVLHKSPLETQIKRETGANPVQSRCCNFHKWFLLIQRKPLPYMVGRRVKRNKPEDLQNESIAHIAFEEEHGSLFYFIIIYLCECVA